MTPIIVYCTCPDTATATHLASLLVRRNLAACVNQLPAIISTYKWQNDIQHDAEVLLMIKTARERFEAIRQLVNDEHPYELPELIAVNISEGTPEYLEWIKQCIK